jgi:hypothetical protein
MKSKLRTAAANAIALWLGAPQAHANIIYAINDTVGTGTLMGTITTEPPYHFRSYYVEFDIQGCCDNTS